MFCMCNSPPQPCLYQDLLFIFCLQKLTNILIFDFYIFILLDILWYSLICGLASVILEYSKPLFKKNFVLPHYLCLIHVRLVGYLISFHSSWMLCPVYLFFNWSIVDLQCCINFCCTAKWISFLYIYIIFQDKEGYYIMIKGSVMFLFSHYFFSFSLDNF